MVGHANRLALPQTFLDFCGSFPIYNIGQTSKDSMMSSFMSSVEEGREGRIYLIKGLCNNYQEGGSRTRGGHNVNSQPLGGG